MSSVHNSVPLIRYIKSHLHLINALHPMSLSLFKTTLNETQTLHKNSPLLSTPNKPEQHNMDHNKMNHYYYYQNYNSSCSSPRLKINNHHHQQSTPPTIKQHEQLPKMMRMRQVQVVYYLSRNGQLEHPHFMELTLTSPQLHLKDVLQRLIALRGKDMPSLYSWSCKRSYKHGYVWNDLSYNDIVYPSQPPNEYVLKGSHLPQNTITQTLTLTEQQEVVEDQEDGEISNSNSSYSVSVINTPPSKSSIGIATDDIDILNDYDDDSPQLSALSSSSSDKCIVEPSRNSVLLQLVACGGRSNRCGMWMKVVGDHHKEERKVVCESPVKSCGNKVDEEDKDMIKCMSENPRFGGFQTEIKESFSGSIVEDVAAEERVAGEPSALKRSNSYDEERKKAEEERPQRREEVKVEREMVMRGKCIPRRKKKQSDHQTC